MRRNGVVNLRARAIRRICRRRGSTTTTFTAPSARTSNNSPCWSSRTVPRHCWPRLASSSLFPVTVSSSGSICVGGEGGGVCRDFLSCAAALFRLFRFKDHVHVVNISPVARRFRPFFSTLLVCAQARTDGRHSLCASIGLTRSWLASKQRPRRITVRGTDRRVYDFLLKAHEDLRQDERVMQLFGLVNTLLKADRTTANWHSAVAWCRSRQALASSSGCRHAARQCGEHCYRAGCQRCTSPTQQQAHFT